MYVLYLPNYHLYYSLCLILYLTDIVYIYVSCFIIHKLYCFRLIKNNNNINLDNIQYRPFTLIFTL